MSSVATVESSTNTSDEVNVEQTLLSIPINTENDALTVLVGFINIAQRRGCFNLPESSKIWDCIQKFQRK